jgi:hypothetical protein
MPVIQVNEKAFEGQGEYEPIPVGTKLRVSVFDIDKTVTGPNSTNPGKDQFVFTAKVTEEGAYNGREIRYNYIPLYPEAGNAWSLVAFAEAVGWKTEKGKGVDVPENLKSVLGTEFLAKIGQTNSQKINPATDKPYVNNRVTGYAKLSGKPTPKPDDEQVSWDDV